MPTQNSYFLILAAPACAWVCGMGLFKTLLMMVLMHRYLPHGQFAGPLGELFSQDWFFYGACAIGTVEFLIDFVPWTDIQWQRWTGHLRIIGAAILSWVILSHEDVMSRIIMVLVAIALSLTSYVATASARRAAICGSTGAFVSPIASITEDCMIAATLAPLTQLPPMTLLMVAFMCMASLLIIYVVRPEARDTFAWLFAGKWVQPHPRDTSGEHEA